MSLKSRLSKAYNNKGIALIDLGKIEESIVCFDKAIELSPENKHYMINKGIAFHELGEVDKALECYDKAIIDLEHQIAIESNIGISTELINLSDLIMDDVEEEGTTYVGATSITS